MHNFSGIPPYLQSQSACISIIAMCTSGRCIIMVMGLKVHGCIFRLKNMVTYMVTELMDWVHKYKYILGKT